MKKYLLLFLLPIFLNSCKNSGKKISSDHKSFFITTAPGIKLEVLDWGGKGEPVMFLAGLGNTAHVFDEYAPQFTDDYHVLGLTRRGFGASSQPDSGYDNLTLAKDILAVIDSLKIEKITLIGHSIAGEEMTKFAAVYPNRVNKLVYIDAAYDRTIEIQNMLALMPSPPAVKQEDSASWQSVQQYYKRVMGIHVCEEEIKTGCVWAKDGRVVRDVTKESTYAAYMNGSEKPAYEKVLAPALAFFNVADSARDNFAFYDSLDSSGRVSAQKIFEIGNPFLRKQLDLFKKEVVKGQVVEIHRGNHYLFMSNPKEVTAAIRKFLGTQ